MVPWTCQSDERFLGARSRGLPRKSRVCRLRSRRCHPDLFLLHLCCAFYQQLAYLDVLRALNLAMSVPALRLSASSASRIVRLAPTWTRYRSIHARRELPYPVEGGLGDFLPPAALKTVAVDWQEGLLQRLNEEVKGESSLLQVALDLCLTKSAKARHRRIRRSYKR